VNFDLKNPSMSLPSNVRQLMILAIAEGYRPELVDAATKELGELLANIYVLKVVKADPRHATPALDAILDGADDSDAQTAIAQAELAKLRRIIKEQQEQMERTEKVLADSMHGVKQVLAWNKRLDELQAENTRLKEEIQDRAERDAGADL
jgi:septal ring factor EnvC (AmiA/AmiB activator)